MIEWLASLTAVTDPAANIAIIGGAFVILKHHLKIDRHDIRIVNLEREVFKQ